MPMLAIFEYDFMIRAFAAGIITAVVAPMIGMFLVTRRYSFMADTLAHVSLAGVAIGFFTGLQPIITSVVASVVGALCVEELRSKRRVLGESALALFLSGGLALAAVLLSVARGLNVNLSTVLFGSIATVTRDDLFIIIVLGLSVIVSVGVLYRWLLASSFDEELAAASGLPTRFIGRFLVVLAAVTVSLSMRIVGILLVGALMVIPVLAAMQWGLGFRKTFFLAIAFSLSAVIAGLFLAFYVGLSSGGTIVLLAIAMFITSAVLRPNR